MLFHLRTLPITSAIPAMLASASSSLALLLATVRAALATAVKYVYAFFAMGDDAPQSTDERDAQPTTTTTALDATATAEPTTTAIETQCRRVLAVEIVEKTASIECTGIESLVESFDVPPDVVENEYTEIVDPFCGKQIPCSLPRACDASDDSESSSASTTSLTESSDSDCEDSDRDEDRLAQVPAKYESASRPLLYLTEPTMFADPRRPRRDIYAHIKTRTDSNNHRPHPVPSDERVREAMRLLKAKNRAFRRKLAAKKSSIGRAKVAPLPLEDAGRARRLEDERLGRATPDVNDTKLVEENQSRASQESGDSQRHGGHEPRHPSTGSSVC